MRDSNGVGQIRLAGFFKSVKRHQLAFACVVIALCFALGNDIYRAKAIVLKNKDLFPGKKRVVNYLDATKGQALNTLLHTDLSRQYLVNPNRTAQKTIIKALAGGNTCGVAATTISTFPYNDAAGTTVGKADDYKISSSPQACPACSGFTFSTANTIGRGNVYAGTGVGPDATYRVVFSAPGNLTVNMTPQTGRNLALLLYGATCSNSGVDLISSSDFAYQGGAERIVVGSMPAGIYHIVVDGYGYTPATGQQGTYSLNVTSTAIPTAAGVTVSGRLLTAEGRGIINARVSLTNPDGSVRYAISRRGGYYQFDDVEVGATYIFTAQSRRYQFDNPTRVISLTDAIADLDFIAISTNRERLLDR